MTDQPPAELDFDKPTIARAYDALLGGKDNFAADRALADHAIQHIPGLRESAVSYDVTSHARPSGAETSVTDSNPA